MEKEKEVWKRIKNFETSYAISNWGRVYSIPRKTYYHDGRVANTKGKILKLNLNKKGYLCVTLTKTNDFKQTFLVSRLVGTYFVSNPENKPQINHIDTIKINNYYKNLEWVTNSENQIHAFANNLQPNREKSNNPACFLKEEQIKEIRAKYIPKLYTMKMLANEYKVCASTICAILQRKLWNYEGL